MKLTCTMIVAVLLLTACIIVSTDDSRNGFTRKARHEKKTSASDEDCKSDGSLCYSYEECCGGNCFIGCW
uniref:Conotoxin n=1 Tax=Conus praecellens TaxID=128530 RepID=A0A291C2N6_CONPC|nr:conotoxin [Conus praecellens]